MFLIKIGYIQRQGWHEIIPSTIFVPLENLTGEVMSISGL